MDGALAGTSIELGPNKHKAQVLEGAYTAPDHLPLEVLHEVPELVAFVGRKDDRHRVLDATPIFIAGKEPLTPTRAGIVLLCDMARDFTVENRVAGRNFTLGKVNQLEQHVLAVYGEMTLQYLGHSFLNKALGVENSRFLAKRQVRILRVNYPELGKLATADKSRILLKQPFTVLAKFDPGARFKTLLDLALYLGTAWVQMEAQLLARYPHMADRSKYFGDFDGDVAAA